jgi:hypothetical protein
MSPAAGERAWADAKKSAEAVLQELTRLCDAFDRLARDLGALEKTADRGLKAAGVLADLYSDPGSRRAIVSKFREIRDRAHAFRGYVNSQDERAGHEHYEGLPDVGRKLRHAVESAEDHLAGLNPPTGIVGLRAGGRDVITVMIIDPPAGNRTASDDGQQTA